MENDMTIINSGEVYANKPFTWEAKAEIATNKNIDPDLLDYIDEDRIEIEEWYESCFEDELEALVNTLAPLGYILNGCIDYYGDYEGSIYVKQNEITSVDVHDMGLYEATDETLINKLKERGYTILKNGIEV